MTEDNKIEDILQELGLNLRESRCYTALLELGVSKVGSICKKTKIPSSKIYEILNNLIDKGLVSYITIGKIKHYQASDPKVLISIIEEKQRKLKDVLPQLLLRQKFTRKQNVEVFEGQKAIFALFTDMINDARRNEKYFVFSIDEENKSDQANLFFKNLAVRRKEKGLDVKTLKNMRHYIQEKHTKMELRYTAFNFPQGITVFRNNVIMLSWSDTPTAIRIESSIFAEQFRAFFLELWIKSKS
jgi:HTH-type transcriptional regulator, sugar sensing transcriptional regulator